MTLREQIAEIEHDQWAHWTKHMLDNMTPENIERWKRQAETPYSDLSEREKDADRKWADKSLDLIRANITLEWTPTTDGYTSNEGYVIDANGASRHRYFLTAPDGALLVSPSEALSQLNPHRGSELMVIALEHYRNTLMAEIGG